MSICHSHNLRRSVATTSKPYGLRITLRPGDPFVKLLGADWSRTHWFATAAERDAVEREMSRKHEYSRPGDYPAHVYEKIAK